MTNVSVAVIPRERFRPLPPSLRSLFETIDEDVPVIVVDGGAPEHIRKELNASRAERPFELIECTDFMLPNKARNIALDWVRTKYVAFCDNDIHYWPSWLDALVENAEVNGSAAAAPLILIGPSDPPIIHHAGGSFFLRRDGADRRVLSDKHRYGNVRLPEAERDGFAKAPLSHKNFEYHCVLVNVQAMRAVGGHDERLIMHEHLDSSLRLMMMGGRLTFEPTARVMYRAFVRFEDEDWPYFLFRWALHRAETSDRVFAENWRVYKRLSASRTGWIRKHRERAMRTRLPCLPKPLARGRIEWALQQSCRRRILSLDTKKPDDGAATVLKKPPVDGLQKAGIELA
jgi:glycosyltransferase involved in cell wall biosynthesis